MSKQLVTAVVGLVVIGISAFTALPQPVSAPIQEPVTFQPPTTPATSTQPTTQPTTPTPTPVSGYTLQQVQAHKDSTNCWTAINGNVYNLTSWISAHPGGDRAILGICGKDGSAAFNGEHGGEKRPTQTLSTFIIGPLNP